MAEKEQSDEKESANPPPELCESCRKRKPEVSLQQTIGSREDTVHLCMSCAWKIGIRGGETVLPLTVGDLFAGVLDPEGTSTRDERACLACGTAFREIRLSGRVGCAECFSTFHAEIESLLPRLAARTRHEGTVPKRLHTYKRLFVDRADLKQRLDAALRDENYEAAAQLRDAILDIDEEGDNA